MRTLEVKWLWVQERVSEYLATKYLSRSRKDVLLPAGNLVLVSGERGTSGEYILMNSGGTSGEYILMNSEVNLFLLIIFVGGILIGVLYSVFTEALSYVHVESNGEVWVNRLMDLRSLAAVSTRCRAFAERCFVVGEWDVHL